MAQDWRTRRRAIDGLLPELAALVAVSLSSTTPSDVVDLSLQLAWEADRTGAEPQTAHQYLRANALSLDDFDPINTLSSPSPFARVELVRAQHGLTRAGSNQVYVLKTLERRWGFRMRAQQSPQAELAILRLSLAVPRPPIPQLLASFLSPTHFHLLLSHAPGGDLWTLLEQQNPVAGIEVIGLDECWVRRWMIELVEAVEWLHGEGWAHRDLKPANLLLSAEGKLLLTDFGSAAPLGPGGSVARKFARALVGTPDYIAPCVLKMAERVVEDSFESIEEDDGEERAYGAEVDWWSFGVLMYEMLYGQAPFFAESIADTYDRIVNFTTNLSFPSTPRVSQSAEDLLRMILVAAKSRPSANLIKAHTWFSKEPQGSLFRSATPLYTPPSFLPPTPSSPSIQQDKSNSIDFSAFFSSPGLSILRPSPNTGDAARIEEAAYWSLMTTLPSALAFSHFSGPSLRPNTTAPQRAFETPARPLFRAKSGSPAPGQGSSGRARRLVGEVEAWKEMQEHAWEVGMTARKMGRGGGRAVRGEGEKEEREKKGELESLEKRQRGVLLELDGLEERYERLFRLAKEG